MEVLRWIMNVLNDLLSQGTIKTGLFRAECIDYLLGLEWVLAPNSLLSDHLGTYHLGIYHLIEPFFEMAFVTAPLSKLQPQITGNISKSRLKI